MADKNIVIVFKSDGMGVTDNQELREVLARRFLALIADADILPNAICFYTDGVKLACEGSPILAELAGVGAAGRPPGDLQDLPGHFRPGRPGARGHRRRHDRHHHGAVACRYRDRSLNRLSAAGSNTSRPAWPGVIFGGARLTVNGGVRAAYAAARTDSWDCRAAWP